MQRNRRLHTSFVRDRSRNGTGRTPRRAFVASFHRLEERMLLSTFLVDTTQDDGTGSIVGSLSWAIDQANFDPNPQVDTIDFNISGTGPFTIAPTSPLPPINHPVIIDGYSQSGASPNTQTNSDDAVLQIVLSGANTSGDGLVVSVGGCTIQGLAINQFNQSGIHILASSTQNLVAGDFIGTDATGSSSQANFQHQGVLVDGSNSNTIGGTTPADRNVLSGNAYQIWMQSGASGNLVAGNFVGLTASGTSIIGTYGNGVFLQFAGTNTVGGTTAGARNVIAGQLDAGVYSLGYGNVIQGNYIGTDPTGTKKFDNGYGYSNSYGVILDNSSTNCTVGGTATGAGNVLSGNYTGLVIDPTNTNNNIIQGNLIGTDASGTASVGNTSVGIDDLGSGNTIGGTTPGAANVIASNGSDGIALPDGNQTSNVVQGNFIGVDSTRAISLGNVGYGISVYFGSSNNTIGGTAIGAGNVIADNQQGGIRVGFGTTDQATGNAILSNSIFGNHGLGIDLGADGVTPNHGGGPIPGPNQFQNYPVLAAAADFGGGFGTAVKGSLNSAPNTSFTLQFFATPAADPSGFGQGQIFLGSSTVTTDANGNGAFQASFSTTGVAGDVISATATDPNGNTSEFAADLTIVSATPPVLAADDVYNTDVNTTLTVPVPGVLANDLSFDGGSIIPSVVSQPNHGNVTLNPDGSFTYLPNTDYVGPDTFTYQDTEGTSTSPPATVTINVNPKTFYVTNTNDSGTGSLRWAIDLANISNSAPPDSILFNIPGTGPFTIAPTTPFPAITHATIIDGYSQPGASPNSLVQGDNALLLIDLGGGNTGPNDGLDLVADGSTVRGVALNYNNVGVHVRGNNELVAGNFIGTDTTGSIALSNTEGIIVDGSSGSTIGGTTPADRNLISGNSPYFGNGENILLTNGASATVVEGNYIGTDASGTQAVPGIGYASAFGILITGAKGNLIGGTASGAGNLISGNEGDGIRIIQQSGPDSGENLIQGNLIGTDASGTKPLGNSGVGIDVVDAASNTIGGTAVGAGNLISANSASGIAIGGLYYNQDATNNLILGNLIGIDISGTKPLANSGDGISLGNAQGNTIGGSLLGSGNVVSANGGYGIDLSQPATDTNLIQGNLIGTDVSATNSLGNTNDGILIGGSANTIGGTTSGDGNVISANGGNGIEIAQYAGSGNLIQGNMIGTDITGTHNLGNTLDGVLVGMSQNSIGGMGSGAGNTIAFNGGIGVGVLGNVYSPANQVAILSNSIFANSKLGIDLGLDGVTPNHPGGSTSGPNNFQNYPVLVAAADFGAGFGTVVKSSLNSTPNTSFTLQFFASPTPDPSGFGQGQIFLGSSTVTTDPSGNVTFQATFSTTGVVGDVISATATDPSGNTSEFSSDIPILAASPPITAFNDEYNDDVNYTLAVAAPGVLTNDLSVSSQPFTAKLVKAPSVGKLSLKPDGSFTYTPKDTFIGDVTFSYVDIQGSNTSNVATVTIHVNPKLYTVTNTSDAGTGSLRWALDKVNLSNSPGAVTVQFDIPGTSPFTIAPATPLPTINHSVVIDGYSQPGAKANSLAQGDNAVILVDLSGASLGSPADGLVLTASSNTVRGLDIGGFVNGIHVLSSYTLIAGNFLGTDLAGTSSQANYNAGVLLDGSQWSIVGGTTPANRNLISGNTSQNVELINGATGNVVQGNFLGTDVTGTKALSTPFYSGNGVLLEAAPGNTIGGTASGAGNLISGNNSNGIVILRPFNGPESGKNVIQGNLIGTDVTGTKAIGNSQFGIGAGIQVNDAESNSIGGTAKGARNVISATNGHGIQIFNGNANNNLIQGNYIGVDITGSVAMGNGGDGINVSYSSGNTIGGTAKGAGNVVSGNAGSGIKLDSGYVGLDLIQGNFLGTDASGTKPLGNAGDGLLIADQASNTIGGTSARAANVVSANGGNGIELYGTFSSYNSVQGNLVGTDITGTQNLGNGKDGILAGVSYNTIGGGTSGSGNIIAFNGGAGVGVVIPPFAYSVNQISILSNSIFSNAALGIDLGGDGVTPNQPPGSASGPNNGQNFPMLTVAGRLGNDVKIELKGSLNSTPSTTYTIQFFANPVADPSGYGQGRSLIGTTSVTTDSNGNATFQYSFKSSLSQGQFISATATDPSGDTSEFSADVRVIQTTDPLIAQDDSFQVSPNNTLNVAAPGVQANDIDLLGGTFSTSLVTGPSHGSLTLNSDGSFTYSPDTDYRGLDTFTYDNVHGSKTSNVATVTIDVNPITYTVTTTSNSGIGSLRWAITQADVASDPNPVFIDFNIPGTGPFTITPGSLLPTITHPVIIDGYTQPGASPNTQTDSDNAVLQIVLDAGGVFGDSLAIAASNSTIRGLVIEGAVYGNGLHLLPGSSQDTIAGNFVGTDVTGNAARYNYQGIVIDGSNNNTIGGTTPADRNLVSANYNQNIFLINNSTGNQIEGNFVGLNASGTSSFTTYGNGVIMNYAPNNTVGGTTSGAGNVIGGQAYDGVQIGGLGGSVVVGNIIGTDPTGTVALPNGNGVAIRYGASDNTIGGSNAGAGNLVSGNGNGIAVYDGGSGNLIQGNLVGTDASGTGRLPNTAGGIVLYGSSNTIGGTVTGAGNVIAFNSGAGVNVTSGFDQDAILANSIYGNGNLGINLGSGANQNQSPPILSSAIYLAGNTTIAGTLSGVSGTTYVVQFFANQSPDPTGFGQGQTLLGTATVTTDSTGNATFSISFATTNTTGEFVSATATDPSGNTSPFAQDIISTGSAAATARPTVVFSSTRTKTGPSDDSLLLGGLDEATLNELATEMIFWTRQRARKQV